MIHKCSIQCYQTSPSDVIKISNLFAIQQVSMPTPESASAAAYGSAPGGMPYTTNPSGPGDLGFGVSRIESV